MFSFLRNLFFIISLLPLMISCGGGGGGGGGGGANVDPEGFWTGTFTQSGVTYNFEGVIHNNKFIGISVDAGVLYTGNIGISGNQMTGSIDVLIIGGGFDHTTSVSATVVAGTSINGSATDSGPTSTFSLSYDSLWDRTPDLSIVAGTYSVTSGPYTYTMTVASNGAYTGSDTDGCNYGGTITPFDTSHNYYRLTMTVTNCGIENGTYSGTSFMDDFNVTNDNLVVIIDDPSYLLILGTLRQ